MAKIIWINLDEWNKYIDHVIIEWNQFHIDSLLGLWILRLQSRFRIFIHAWLWGLKISKIYFRSIINIYSWNKLKQWRNNWKICSVYGQWLWWNSTHCGLIHNFVHRCAHSLSFHSSIFTFTHWFSHSLSYSLWFSHSLSYSLTDFHIHSLIFTFTLIHSLIFIFTLIHTDFHIHPHSLRFSHSPSFTHWYSYSPSFTHGFSHSPSSTQIFTFTLIHSDFHIHPYSLRFSHSHIDFCIQSHIHSLTFTFTHRFSRSLHTCSSNINIVFNTPLKRSSIDSSQWMPLSENNLPVFACTHIHTQTTVNIVFYTSNRRLPIGTSQRLPLLALLETIRRCLNVHTRSHSINIVSEQCAETCSWNPISPEIQLVWQLCNIYS